MEGLKAFPGVVFKQIMAIYLQEMRLLERALTFMCHSRISVDLGGVILPNKQSQKTHR